MKRKPESRVISRRSRNAASKVLRDPNGSKKAKTAAGLDITQRFWRNMAEVVEA